MAQIGGNFREKKGRVDFQLSVYDLNDALSSNIVMGDRSPEDRSVGIEFGFDTTILLLHS